MTFFTAFMEENSELVEKYKQRICVICSIGFMSIPHQLNKVILKYCQWDRKWGRVTCSHPFVCIVLMPFQSFFPTLLFYLHNIRFMNGVKLSHHINYLFQLVLILRNNYFVFADSCIRHVISCHFMSLAIYLQVTKWFMCIARFMSTIRSFLFTRMTNRCLLLLLLFTMRSIPRN